MVLFRKHDMEISFQENGTWTGVVGDLVTGEVMELVIKISLTISTFRNIDNDISQDSWSILIQICLNILNTPGGRSGAWGVGTSHQNILRAAPNSDSLNMYKMLLANSACLWDFRGTNPKRDWGVRIVNCQSLPRHFLTMTKCSPHISWSSYLHDDLAGGYRGGSDDDDERERGGNFFLFQILS